MSDFDFADATWAAMQQLAPKLLGKRLFSESDVAGYVIAGDYDDDQSPEEAARDFLADLIRPLGSACGRDAWDALDTPIFCVLEPETGENIADAQMRPLGRIKSCLWLYVDSVDGFSLLDVDDVRRLDPVSAAGQPLREHGAPDDTMREASRRLDAASILPDLEADE